MGTCNTADGDCDKATSTTTGLAHSRTITDGTTSYTFGTGLGANNWRDVLRVVYAGSEGGDGNNIALRDCNGAVRKLIVQQLGQPVRERRLHDRQLHPAPPRLPPRRGVGHDGRVRLAARPPWLHAFALGRLAAQPVL